MRDKPRRVLPLLLPLTFFLLLLLLLPLEHLLAVLGQLRTEVVRLLLLQRLKCCILLVFVCYYLLDLFTPSKFYVFVTQVKYYVIYVTAFIYYAWYSAVCCVLRAACCVLRAACCVLRASCWYRVYGTLYEIVVQMCRVCE